MLFSKSLLLARACVRVCVVLAVRSGAFKGHVWGSPLQQSLGGERGRYPHPGRLAQRRAAQSTGHRFYQQASAAKETPLDKFLLPWLFTSLRMKVFFFYLIHRCSVLRQLGCKDGKNWNSKYVISWYMWHKINTELLSVLLDALEFIVLGSGQPELCYPQPPYLLIPVINRLWLSETSRNGNISAL